MPDLPGGLSQPRGRDAEGPSWPSTGSTPYGTCTGTNSTACSWEYGWLRARYSATAFTQAAKTAPVDARISSYIWWLDVETANSWEADTATSNLAGRNSWLPGATTLSAATANCAKPALTPGGRVTLAQYVVNGLDRNQSCG